MEIFHQLNFRSDETPRLVELIKEYDLEFNAVDLPNKTGQSIRLRIPESNKAWSLILPWVGNTKIRHHVETYFSEREISEAEWLRVKSVYAHGYPQPEDTWVTRPNNLADVCRICGTYRQVSPFRIKEEPNLGKRQFMSLEWTGGILFTLPLVIERLEANEMKGFETWNAILHRTGLPAKTVLQLFTPIITSAGLIDVSEESASLCPECGKTKFGYHNRGRMKYRREAVPGSADIVQTFEWFGAGQGHFAYKEILISNRFARLIIENQWKGLEMKPIELI
jgi:hypothetical protein